MGGVTVTRLPVVPGYESLAAVLDAALDQAQHGKGADRHASGEPFEQQPIVAICEALGGDFAVGQAIKKRHEARRLPPDRAKAELLGAIVYLAAAVIVIDKAEGGVASRALTVEEINDALGRGREEAEAAVPALFGRPGRSR